MKMRSLFPVLAIVIASCGAEAEEKVIVKTDTVVVTEPASPSAFHSFGHLEFPSMDGLTITANSYELIPNGVRPMEEYIILCHQAGFSRGEYRETARRLNDLGYSCLAIDLRSGEECNLFTNETARRAKEKGLPTEYTDAEQDMIAAIDFVYEKTGKPVILLGSSYSASLALKVAVGNEKISKVIAFSPGEYFKSFKLAEKIKGLDKPTFLTSSKKESADLQSLATSISSEKKVVFTPESEGVHGSSALWEENEGNEEYWAALKEFLSNH